eukprot:gene31596-6790_t
MTVSVTLLGHGVISQNLPLHSGTCDNLAPFLNGNACGTYPPIGLGDFSCQMGPATVNNIGREQSVMSVCASGDEDAVAWVNTLTDVCSITILTQLGYTEGCDVQVEASSSCVTLPGPGIVSNNHPLSSWSCQYLATFINNSGYGSYTPPGLGSFSCSMTPATVYVNGREKSVMRVCAGGDEDTVTWVNSLADKNSICLITQLGYPGVCDVQVEASSSCVTLPSPGVVSQNHPLHSWSCAYLAPFLNGGGCGTYPPIGLGDFSCNMGPITAHVDGGKQSVMSVCASGDQAAVAWVNSLTDKGSITILDKLKYPDGCDVLVEASSSC